MHLQKLTNYRPNYPRKALQSAALTAAALVAMGGAAGCRLPVLTSGAVAVPAPTEQGLVLDGEVSIPEPTEEPMLRTEGIVAFVEPTPEPVVMGKFLVPEPTEDPMERGGDAMPEPTEEPLILDGEVAVAEP